MKEFFSSTQSTEDCEDLPDEFFEEEDSEDDLFECTTGEDEDIMMPDSGPFEERMKNSRQFRANLDALFRSVYEREKPKRIEEIKSLVVFDLEKQIDRTKIIQCMKNSVHRYLITKRQELHNLIKQQLTNEDKATGVLTPKTV